MKTEIEYTGITSPIDFYDYISLALRTESVVNSVDIDPRLLHAVIGFCTEVREYVNSENSSNDIEELGDIFWYLAIAFNALDLDDTFVNLLQTEYGDKEEELDNFCTAIADLITLSTSMLDVTKKHIYYSYNRTEEELTILFKEAVLTLTRICFITSFPLTEVLETNIIKLQKRYPNKYTHYDAIHRDVENELSHINKNT